jgi:transcriptional regulator with XRE-family HTH domain
VTRPCAGCGNPLSRYNPQDRCAACQAATRPDAGGDRRRALPRDFPWSPAPPADLGGRLRELRRGCGLSQEQLADKAGVSVDLISKLEQGRRTSARLESLGLLAGALGVGTAQLFGRVTAAGQLGGRLAAVRKRRGLTQRELAEASGVSLTVISKLEQGEREGVRAETARKLAAALQVPVSVLLAGPDCLDTADDPDTGRPELAELVLQDAEAIDRWLSGRLDFARKLTRLRRYPEVVVVLQEVRSAAPAWLAAHQDGVRDIVGQVVSSRRKLTPEMLELADAVQLPLT